MQERLQNINEKLATKDDDNEIKGSSEMTSLSSIFGYNRGTLLISRYLRARMVKETYDLKPHERVPHSFRGSTYIMYHYIF